HAGGGGGGVDHAGGRGPRPGPRRASAALGRAPGRASELIGGSSAAVSVSAVVTNWPGDAPAALSKAVVCLSAKRSRRIVRRSFRRRWLVVRCCLSWDSL